MDPATTIAVSWSSGKDSAYMLGELLNEGSQNITLFTTLTEGYRRINMHGVREELLERQVAAIGLPIRKAFIPQNASNEDYEHVMREAVNAFLKKGIDTMAFADLFLEDIRRYREDRMEKAGMHPIFPLWQRDTEEMAYDLVDRGYRAIVTCVDTQQLDRSFIGRILDRDLLSDLPQHVDPCGENGEFHTFVYQAPYFDRSIPVTPGRTVDREERFCFCELELAE